MADKIAGAGSAGQPVTRIAPKSRRDELSAWRRTSRRPEFDIEFFTVARWEDGQIVEENLMYDLVTFMKQIGLGE